MLTCLLAAFATCVYLLDWPGLQAYLEKREATPADAVHALSEGYGFIFSLPFTNDGEGKPYFTWEEVSGFLDQMDNFWQIDFATEPFSL